MIDGKRVLGLVCARGGSKGVPRKNLRKLGGRPLVAWSIASARAISESPPLRCSRIRIGRPSGSPPQGGVTRKVTTTRFKPQAETVRVRVDRTASRHQPAPQTFRPQR